MNEFKVGDRVYCNMQRGTVTRMNGETVIEVDFGDVSMGAGNLQCYPDTYWVAFYANICYSVYQSVVTTKNKHLLNVPEIYKFFIFVWEKLMQAVDDTVEINRLILYMQQFARGVVQRAEEVSKETINSIHIFGRR